MLLQVKLLYYLFPMAKNNPKAFFTPSTGIDTKSCGYRS